MSKGEWRRATPKLDSWQHDLPGDRQRRARRGGGRKLRKADGSGEIAGKVPWSDGEVAELPLQGALLIARKRELFNHAASVAATPALRSSWRERRREA